MKADTERILNGEEPTKESESKNYIGRDYSGSDSGIARFGEWVANNEKRIEGAKSLPYFLSDNKGLIKGAAPTQTTVTEIDKLAKAIGVDVGAPMTHEQADMMHPNPHYKEDEQYRVNCQSTVVAYELRRRGLPVEAFGRTADGVGTLLRGNTRAAWTDANGNIPTPIVCRQTVKSRTVDRRGYVRATYTTEGDVWRDFLAQTSQEGRYHVSWRWAGKEKGHIITMETFADGTRRFYDPQTGIEAKNILPWAGIGKKTAIDFKAGIRAYRVDNLQPNSLIVKGVVKKAGSTMATPVMTVEQKAWWIKNVTKKTEGSVNSFNKKMLETTKGLRRDRERFKVSEISTVKNLQTGLLKRSGEPRKNLIDHLYSKEEVHAAEYAWNNPNVLKFVERSEMGAVKDMTKPSAQKNIKNKIKRHVTHYNLYKFDYNGTTWNVKLEVLDNGMEQFYCMVKTRNP